MTAVSVLRFVPEFDPAIEPVVARARARTALRSPVRVAVSIAVGLLDAEAGVRPVAQLEWFLPPELWASLTVALSGRRNPKGIPAGRIRRVLCQELEPGLADLVVVLQRGPRAAAVALRLDAQFGRWVATEVAW